MGKYLQGILGPFSGRVGNVIGTFWKGRSIMRIRAASYSNPNTIPQQTQRMKWKLVSSFLTANQKLIRLGFAAVNRSFTAFNNAMKYHLENAITGAFPTLELDLTKVKLSIGTMAGLVGAALSSTAPGTINIDWDDNSNNIDASADDEMFISLIDETTGEVVIGAGATRVSGTTTVQLPALWAGKNVVVHAFFIKSGTRDVTESAQVSESQYLGTVAVA